MSFLKGMNAFTLTCIFRKSSDLRGLLANKMIKKIKFDVTVRSKKQEDPFKAHTDFHKLNEYLSKIHKE